MIRIKNRWLLVLFSLAFVIGASSRVFSQGKILVDYEIIEDFGSSQRTCNATLSHRGSSSVYQISDCEYESENGYRSINRLQDEGLEAFYIDFGNKNITYGETILGNKNNIVVSEEIPEMKWENTKRDTLIMGMAAKIMRTHFRGRDYEVAYTEELPLIGGPWKFVTLPGLVLYARTLGDQRLIITARIIEQDFNDLERWKVVEKLKSAKKIYSMSELCKAKREGLKKVRIAIESRGTEDDPSEFSFYDSSLEKGTYDKNCVE